MPKEQHVKFGGVKFENNVSPAEINDFVKNLPDTERKSLFQVIKKLDQAGLITLDDSDLSTIDDETIDWQI